LRSSEKLRKSSKSFLKALGKFYYLVNFIDPDMALLGGSDDVVVGKIMAVNEKLEQIVQLAHQLVRVFIYFRLVFYHKDDW